MASLRIGMRGLARPWSLALAATLAALPALWIGLADIGISTRESDPAALFYDVAFMGSVLGALIGLQLADEWDWVVRRRPPGEILRHEAALLGAPVAGLVAIPLLWGLVDAWRGQPLLPLAALLGLARPVAVGLALRRLPWSAAPRALGLLALCWWIPATLAPTFPIGLGPAAHLAAERGDAAVLATPGPWVAETSMLLALLLAARLGLGSATRRT